MKEVDAVGEQLNHLREREVTAGFLFSQSLRVDQTSAELSVPQRDEPSLPQSGVNGQRPAGV